MSGPVKSTILAFASVLAMAGTASASLVIESWNESNPGALVAGIVPGGSATNEFLTVLGPSTLDGYYGSQIRLTKAAEVTYTWLGFEAGFANKFVAGGTFDTEAYAPNNNIFSLAGLASFTQTASAGLLDFRFLTNGGAGSIINGNENTNNVGAGGVRNPDFFASVVGAPTAVSGRSIYVLLDDLGAGPDDNHDDFVVRIDVAAVPLPAGVVLMGTALAGLGALRRRKA